MQLTSPQLPLAVYREIAAHLRQVDGVDASLILRPTTQQPEAQFDYYQSQVAAIQIDFAENIAPNNRQQAQDILNYYAQRYRSWETVRKIANS